MSPIRPSKRRRIDASSHTLSQPFKSPFKTPRTAPSTTSSPAKETTTSSPTSPPSTLSALEQVPTTTSSAIPQPTPNKSPQPCSHLHTTTTSSQLSALRTQHTHLLNLLATARSTLETSTQALSIETSSRHAELPSLIQTWKHASRAAAEEVFAKARDRVNKMGGVGAMRERERSRKMGSWGWDEAEGEKVQGERGEEDGDGVDGAGFGGEKYEAEREGEVRDEREEGGRREEQEEVEDEEGGYTMDMMLKSLNIELGVIGYNKGLQRWVD